MRVILLCLSLTLTASPFAAGVSAQEALGLAAPEAVAQSGLLRHLLPRFSLKTGIRLRPDPAGPMRLTAAPPGMAVFRRNETTYYLRIAPGDARQQRFRDWLTSEIGKRAIEGFRPDGGAAPFSASIAAPAAPEKPAFTGDAARGATLALRNCGRCHVIGPQNRTAGLGSTPSFPALRALPDWNVRFQSFYARPPHRAFTQIDGLTTPFSPELPPPVYPLRITQRDLEAILAFVAAMQAADLGRALQFQ